MNDHDDRYYLASLLSRFLHRHGSITITREIDHTAATITDQIGSDKFLISSRSDMEYVKNSYVDVLALRLDEMICKMVKDKL